MIDWYNLAMNACWILGCAVVLATLSYVSWESAMLGERFRVRLGRSDAQVFLNLGGLFFCIGLAGTTDIIWQRALWILLVLGFIRAEQELLQEFGFSQAQEQLPRSVQFVAR